MASTLVDQQASASLAPLQGFLQDAGSPAVSPQAVQRQLSKIVASHIFARSKQLCRFLRFVVEEALTGNADGLKESLIGTIVFERGELFNPGIDPIVRVQARRLRTKLEEYYETEGRRDLLVIGLRTGSYSPAFVTRANEAVEPSRSSPAATSAEIQQSIAECERALNINREASLTPYNPLDTGATMARVSEILLRVLDLTRRVAELPAVRAAAVEAGAWHAESAGLRHDPVQTPRAVGRPHFR